MRYPLQIINESDIITDTELVPMVAAVQLQVTRDLLPIWGVDAAITLVSKDQQPNNRAWWVVLLDTPEDAELVANPGTPEEEIIRGYYDVTSRALPLGKVYARATRQFGTSLSVALSQEILGMLTDPHLVENRANADHTMIYALDICSPVEHQRYGYSINNVHVSNFVYPSWFLDSGQMPFDQTRQCQAPFQVLPGGHIPTLDLTQDPRSWVETTADAHDVTSRKQEGSRFDRRKKWRGNGKRQISTL